MQSNFQSLQSQAVMVFTCMQWTVFDTSFNGETFFSPFCSDLFKYLVGAPMDINQLSLLVIGSFTCVFVCTVVSLITSY